MKRRAERNCPARDTPSSTITNPLEAESLQTRQTIVKAAYTCKTATPARMGLTGVRVAGRISHPAIASGGCDVSASPSPVDHDKRLGLLLQAAPCDVTGGPVVHATGFPATRLSNAPTGG